MRKTHLHKKPKGGGLKKPGGGGFGNLKGGGVIENLKGGRGFCYMYYILYEKKNLPECPYDEYLIVKCFVLRSHFKYPHHLYI